MNVHPQFDTATCTWFVPGMEAEAASLSLLQEQLPKNSKIEGYFPKGFPEVIWPKDDKNTGTISRSWSNDRVSSGRANSTERMRANALARQEHLSTLASMTVPTLSKVNCPRFKAHRVYKGRKRKYDVELMLDLWVQKVDVITICDRVGGASLDFVYHAINVARKAGDIRAIKRQGMIIIPRSQEDQARAVEQGLIKAISHNTWSVFQLEQLVILAGKGLSATQIAKELHTTKNSVIGKARRLKVQLHGASGAPKKHS